MRPSGDYLNRLPFWNDLTEDEKTSIARNSYVQSFAKNETPYGHGEKCLGMIHLLSGHLRVYILSEDGREITLFRVNPGDSCVISASCVISQIKFETIMEAEENSEMLIVNSGTFQSIADKNLHVKCFMFQVATERFSQVMWVMQEVLFLRFDQRLARFFISEYEKTGKPGIKMTQEEMAKRVNSAREVVARMLKEFASDGLVEVSRGCVTLKDIDAIRLLAS